MAERKELITKVAKRCAGLRYVCRKCSNVIEKGDKYFRVESARYDNGPAERTVKHFCLKHKVRVSVQIDT